MDLVIAAAVVIAIVIVVPGCLTCGRVAEGSRTLPWMRTGTSGTSARAPCSVKRSATLFGERSSDRTWWDGEPWNYPSCWSSHRSRLWCRSR